MLIGRIEARGTAPVKKNGSVSSHLTKIKQFKNRGNSIMKKFTELERNLITVILDGRRSDFKKEQDFERVFGRNANIDLVEGRNYLLEEALFGEVAEVPDIIGDLLYETEAGNIHYDVMIDALEAAVNEDWANVPSEEGAIEMSEGLKK
jgi:hypothetical protein